jgi:hypothetical protein
VFSIVAIFAMAVFMFEVINQTLADPDYFGSFFFVLDCISTVSMLFDIHWTKPILEEAIQKWTIADTKSSKTARLGAKAGRVIRLLRLIRLLKLYKSMNQYVSAEKSRRIKKAESNGRAQSKADDEWGEDDLLKDEEKNEEVQEAESNTGKKLSEVTIRKIIMLALILIFDVPNIVFTSLGQWSLSSYDVKAADDLTNYPGKTAPRSAEYGAQVVFDHFVQYVQLSASHACAHLEKTQVNARHLNASQACSYMPSACLLIVDDGMVDPCTWTHPPGHLPVDASHLEVEDAKRIYYKTILRYIYYHMWFIQEPGFWPSNSCPNDGKGCSQYQPWQLFWVGMSLKGVKYNTDALLEMVRIPRDVVEQFEDEINAPANWTRYSIGRMPPNVKDIIAGEWKQTCQTSDTNDQIFGFSMLREDVPPSDDYRGANDFKVDCAKSGRLRQNSVQPEFLQYRGGTRSLYKSSVEDPEKKWRMYFFFDLRRFNRHGARFNLYILCVLVLMLFWCSWTFSNDAHQLLLFPLERMIHKVKSIAAQPMLATKLAEEQVKAEDIARQRMKEETKFCGCCRRRHKVNSGEEEDGDSMKAPPMETVILEKTIIKLGSLLAVAFGEAGSRVIEQNLIGGDSALVNIMVEGKKVECIIGTIRILNFNVATEVLQTNVLTFLNKIAEIVHGVATQHHGAPITSRGDTFLVSWRLTNHAKSSLVCELKDVDTQEFFARNRVNTKALSTFQQEPSSAQRAVVKMGDLVSVSSTTPKSCRQAAAKDIETSSWVLLQRIVDAKKELMSRLADLSMIAFAEMIGSVQTSRVLAEYRDHPGMQWRLGRQCRVSLSGGLHYGWAIEGAVGSEFKIDPSYLSPNVSMAYNIERATQIYDVTLLVTEALVNILSPTMATFCRSVDRVVIVGSNKPMDLHSVDLDPCCLELEDQFTNPKKYNAVNLFHAKDALESIKQAKLDQCTVEDLWKGSDNIRAMRNRFTHEFLYIFEMGYQNYRSGEWHMAERLLSRTRTMLGEVDGPSNALLRYMEQLDFEAPEDWVGYRELGQLEI